MGLSLLSVVPPAIFCYFVLSAARLLLIHPLRHVPGPRLWICFPILRHISAMRGTFDINMRRFHTQYGEVVRFGPDEVSFITPEAWKLIYGHGHAQLPKVVVPGSLGIDIFSANNVDHSRYRKALSHAFSARGLQQQEPIIKSYVDMLVARLKGFADSQLPVDMVQWYNLTTFDMIGDLAFGESFGGLENSRCHYWVSTIFDFVKVVPFLKLKEAYPAIFPLLVGFLPKDLLSARQKQAVYARNTVQNRLHNTRAHGRGDFMDSMLRHYNEKDGLTDKELEANATFLIIAGSETTVTLLSGVIYWLLKTPKALAKATNEIRSVMQTEEDINMQNVSTKLPYMLACLEEGFRMYPPVPTGQQRQVVTPSNISGYNIPPGTKVSVHQSAAYWSPTNFHNPQSFIPERWLPNAKSDPSSPFFFDKRDVLQPFSVGPRNCIGKNLAYAEMRLILARTLWNFDVELRRESLDWSDQKTYTLWDKHQLMCNVKLRA
ncbi:hypothetical protein N7456_000412 [Penicillium angulare]|uniref:Cytochrome P450 n=1 Tax=Penicillium angulare TaxID=116970 RepID=A0A9W9GC34_9EURO|nr:hypothetical protein N7456_000412 [Penicillium angulare]